MKELERIMDRVREDQDDELRDGTRRLAVRNRLLAQPQRQANRGAVVRGAVGAAGAAIAVAAAALFFWLNVAESSSSALTFSVRDVPREAGEFFSVPTGEPLELSFSDGSTVELGERSAARVYGLSETGAELQLEHGVADVRVVHRNETTRWVVQSGPYTVQVVGTEFRVAWDVNAQVFELDMYEGKVIVEGPEFEARSFGAGEKLRVGPRSSAPDASAVEPNDGSARLPDASPKASELVKSSDVGRTAVSPGRVALRPDPRREDDLQTLLVEGSVAELEARATRARLEGDSRERRVHEVVRERFAGTQAASDAAFYLARYESRHGDRAASERWLRVCLAEAPAGRWTAEATGRLIESLYEAGGTHRFEARDLARQYLRSHPGGSYAAYARRIATE